MTHRSLISVLSFCVCLNLGGLVVTAGSEVSLLQQEQASVSKLLEAGFQDHPVPIEKLERIYASDKEALSGETPYLEYAYALVLSKNLKNHEAEEHLQAAANSESPVILPAREELIRRELKAAHYETALEMLVHHASVVVKISFRSRSAAEAHRAAAWLGLVMAYLEGPADVPDDIIKLAKTANEELILTLGQRFLPDYQKGRDALAETRSRLQDQLKAVTSQFDIKQISKKEEIRKQKNDLAQRVADLKKTSKETQKTLVEQLRDVNGKLDMLEKQFALSVKAEQRLLASQILLQAEINRLKRQREANEDAFLNRNTPAINAFRRANVPQIDQAIEVAETQYALSIKQYVLLLKSRFDLTNQAKATLMYRQNLIDTAGTTAAQAQNQLELMSRWNSRLEAKDKKQDEADSPISSRLQRRLSDLATYDDFSLEHQREMLTQLLKAATAPGEQ